MRIRMVRNPARQQSCGLMEGEEGTVNDELAATLIENGLAVAIIAPEPRKQAKGAETIKSVEAKSRIADATEPEIK